MTSGSPRSAAGVIHGEGKQALLEAAIAVVAEDGLRKLTWRSVARRAGVTHGLVAHHFGSLDVLIANALDLAVQRNIESSRLVSGTRTPESFAADLIDMAVTDTAAQAYQYELVLEARRNPDLRPHVQALLENYRRNARAALVEVGLPDDQPLADLIYAALDGLTFAIYAADDPARASAALGRLQQLLGFLARQRWSPIDTQVPSEQRNSLGTGEPSR